jgi:hypothetical protein
MYLVVADRGRMMWPTLFMCFLALVAPPRPFPTFTPLLDIQMKYV